MGRKMATVVAVDASSAPHTCSGPMSAASSAAMPRSRSRTMFSSTTMAASRVIPTANARPASEMMLTVRPVSSRPRNAAKSEIGIATATRSVARNLRRNSHSTTMASTTPRPEVVADHLDRSVDVGGLVVDLPEHETRAGERAFGELRRRGPEPLHHLEHVHADLAVGVDRDGPHPVGDDEALAVGERDLDCGHVAQPDGQAVAPLQDQLPEILGIERAGEPQRVAPLADAHVAARDVLVGASQAGGSRKLNAEARGPVRVEGDAHLAIAPAVDLGARDAGHALEPGLDDLLPRTPCSPGCRAGSPPRWWS